ncbi:MAG: hypothetical protein GY869_03600 [Planctomycetes bacterium]|nr:hypothetical protein [Planctomycetota bacterium]
MSGTHPAWAADWVNGNIVALLPVSDYELGIQQGWIPFNWYTPNGPQSADLALTAVKIEVINFTLISPTGSEKLVAGNNYTINWDAPQDSTITHILIEYSLNNGINWITEAITANTGSYNWQTPNITSANCLIRISDASNSSVFDISNNVFIIYECQAGYSYLDQWGSLGNSDGKFNYAYGVAIDSIGNVYVVDHHNHRIQKFSSDGVLLGWWGRDNLGGSGWHDPGSGLTGAAGSGAGEFNRPVGIAIDASDNIYIADYLNNRIQKITPENVFISWTGSFSHINGVAVDALGNVYASDEGNHKVKKFTTTDIINYTLDIEWGGFGSGDGQFNIPIGVGVDPYGNVYVCDHYNHRVQKFTSDGTLIGWWGLDDVGFKGWHLPGSGRVGMPGSGEGQLNSTYGLAVSSKGYVFVTDRYNHRVHKFTYDGLLISSWGSSGIGNDQFNEPHGIAVKSNGSIYVADAYSHRVQKFVETPLPKADFNKDCRIDLHDYSYFASFWLWCGNPYGCYY